MDIARRRLARRAALPAAVVAVAAALTAGAALLPGERPPPPPPPAATVPQAAYGEDLHGVTDLNALVAGLQARLARLPRDHTAWATLGSAYVEQARLTADPSYYPKAERALATSLALSPGNHAALTGQAALAAGRHDFAEAVRLATLSARANPYGPAAQGVLADAYTQLGRYADAEAAIGRMLRLRPGVAAYTRASYAAELRGDAEEARRMLELALADAYLPADVAYCEFHLGELALRSGDPDGARRRYARALAAYPAFTPALAGQARALALAGRLAEAAQAYAEVVARLPLPQYVVEYGEVLIKTGADPSAQWRLLAAQRRLGEAAGVRDDLTWAEYQADHGDPAAAVRHARAEYARNPNLVAADALAWALHRAGESAEALEHARKATATGWRNALLRHHRAEIEKALGMTDAARRSARLAREYNPRFDPDLPALARFS
ncbi:tetratricopeptide repeat protein [Thermocatellispora tengchongensis]